MSDTPEHDVTEIIGLGDDKDRSPEEIRGAVLRVHNYVLLGKITTPVATQAIKALELYAKVSGFLVQEQSKERKSVVEGFDAG